jgi:hypothetical protein
MRPSELEAVVRLSAFKARFLNPTVLLQLFVRGANYFRLQLREFFFAKISQTASLSDSLSISQKHWVLGEKM